MNFPLRLIGQIRYDPALKVEPKSAHSVVFARVADPGGLDQDPDSTSKKKPVPDSGSESDRRKNPGSRATIFFSRYISFKKVYIIGIDKVMEADPG